MVNMDGRNSPQIFKEEDDDTRASVDIECRREATSEVYGG